MVNYSTTSDLFGDTVLTIFGLPSDKVFSQNIQGISLGIPEYVELIEVKSWLTIINQQIISRKNAYNHSGDDFFLLKKKLDAIDFLVKYIFLLSNIKKRVEFAEKLKNHFMSKLEIISPSKGSKFYKNYNSFIFKLKEFINNNSK